MKSLQGRGRDIYQEQLAKRNTDTVIYSLRNLGEATSTQIHKFIQDNRSKHVKKFSLRTVQAKLIKLADRGFVVKKGNLYSLSPEGNNEKIFGFYYGKLLYDELMEKIPFPKGSIGDRLEEYVRRVGIYITYIFMQNSNRSGTESQYVRVGREYDEWVNDCISPVRLLEWFNNVFYSKRDANDYSTLSKALNRRFGGYIKNLESSEKIYHENISPSLQRLKAEVLEERRNSLNDS